MLELDLALWSRQLNPVTSSCTPRIIPVLWEEIDTAKEVEAYWQKKLPGLEPERQRWVDPHRWAANACGLREHLQAVRRSGLDPKGEWLALAKQMAEAVQQAMPKQLDVGTNQLCGAGTQKERLLQQLGGATATETRGLWLYGPGKGGLYCMAAVLHFAVMPSTPSSGGSRPSCFVRGAAGVVPTQMTPLACFMMQAGTGRR